MSDGVGGVFIQPVFQNASVLMGLFPTTSFISHDGLVGVIFFRFYVPALSVSLRVIDLGFLAGHEMYQTFHVSYNSLCLFGGVRWGCLNSDQLVQEGWFL